MNGDEFGAIVLAAGKGTRMGSDLPKVLHPLHGKPMICHVLDNLRRVGILRPVLVVGAGAPLVRAALGDGVRYAHQPEQLGSGHAVKCARKEAEGIADHLLILCGDSPLFRPETYERLMKEHLASGATITLTSAVLDDPSGYGRILRNAAGQIAAIVEERDATEEQRAIREVNGGAYAFHSEWLWENIGKMRLNQKGEYCLTDLVDIAIAEGRVVSAVEVEPEEIQGVNTPFQLAEAEEILARRQ